MDYREMLDYIVMPGQLVADPMKANELNSALRDMRNELCFKCGRSTEAYLGACDGCRWRAR